MLGIFQLSPDTQLLLATAIAISISKGMEPLEVNALGNFISLVGSALQAKASQADLIIQELEAVVDPELLPRTRDVLS